MTPPPDPAPPLAGGPPPLRKSGCFGCLFQGSVGCGAFLAGCVLALVLAGPVVLRDSIRESLLGHVAADWDGTLSLDRPRLSFFQSCRLEGLRLADPEGRPVLAGGAVLPPMAHWDDPPGRLEFRLDLEELQLHRDAAGVFNLARALGSGGQPWPAESLGMTLGSGSLSSGRGLRQGQPYRFTWSLEAGRLSDELLPEQVLVLGPFTGQVSEQWGGDLRLTAGGELTLGEQTGRVSLTWEVPGGQDGQGTLTLQELPSAALPLLLGWGQDPSPWLGPTCSGTVQLQGSEDGGLGLVASLEFAHGRAHLRARLEQGRLVASEGEEGLQLECGLDAGPAAVVVWEAGLREALGLELRLHPQEPLTWSAEVGRFELGLGRRGLTADSQLDLVGSLRGRLTVQSGTGEPLAVLEEPSGFAMQLEPQAEPRLELTLSLATPGGDPAGLLVCRSHGGDLRLETTGLRSALVDRLLGSEQLLSQAFGERLRGQVQLGQSAGSGHLLRLTGTGPQAPPARSLRLLDGRLTLADEPGEPWRLSVAPELAAHLLREHLPLLEVLRLDSGAVPLSLAAPVLELGAGGPRLLAGELLLEPGRLQGRLEPTFAALFEDQPAEAAGPLDLASVSVRVAGDRLHYEGLELTLAGRDCELEGSWDRAQDELDLMITGPLEVAGRRLGLGSDQRLEAARVAVDLEMLVRGPRSAPELHVMLPPVLEGAMRGLVGDR